MDTLSLNFSLLLFDDSKVVDSGEAFHPALP